MNYVVNATRHRVLRDVRSLLAAACMALAVGCAADTPPPETPAPMEVGEVRTQTLRYLRFDVSDFEQSYSKQDLLDLPEGIRTRLWLFDLDLSNGPNSPRLLDYSLRQIKDLDPDGLPAAARNMQALLNMTPDNAVLEGTSFEEVAELSPVIGISSAQILADLMQINVEDEFLTTDAVARTILENVIGTHPNAQTRLGPRTAENPEGVYDVTPGSLPVTLEDAASDFATLPDKFGPIFQDGVYHPGFISGEVRSQVFQDDFRMTVRANANALPYKGVDLTDGTTASVNSIASQIDGLFNFDDPDWLQIDGLVPGVPVIESMGFSIVEADGFIPGGRSPFPESRGDSEAWQLPAWTVERILADAARTAFSDLNSAVLYYLPDSDEAAVDAEVSDGWTTIDTAGGLGSPPNPQYLWDVLLEVAQVRLHDPLEPGAEPIPEGEANVEFGLQNVPVGLNSEELEETIRENIEQDPTALLDIASNLLDSTRGAADFYYYRSDSRAPVEEQGDWLFFVGVGDLELGEDGNPTRDYMYERVGFYSDPELANLVSSTVAVGGDTTHHKIRISPGDVLYVEDDEGFVFRLEIGEKPGVATVNMSIERIR